MTDRAVVRLADIKRAIRAAQDGGFTIKEILIQSDGVRLILSGHEKDASQYDDPRLEDWPDAYEPRDPRIEDW